PSGVPVHMDKTAYSADATIVVNRVKPHTLFRGPIESGLMKMMGIGLGKERGANAIHALGPERFDTLIPEMGRHILKHGNIVLGVASVENAREQPVRLVAIEAERIEAEEKKLLAEAKSLMPRILFSPLHVLVVQQVGKNISGDGMDPNVTGRFMSHLRASEPDIQKLVALDLTDQTYGNGLGIGMADVTTRRAVEKLDYYPMYVNSITARLLGGARVPVTLDTDRDAIATAMVSCYGVEGGVYNMLFIQNTLKLEEVYISEGLLPKARSMSNVEVRGEPFEIQFNAAGELQPLFSEAD
ncbi:MAG: hypothetical protein Q8O40_15810, partial [Chloroflexota bacterium]|nr:hypothetical protein [Chloroflexota bacterium]